MLFAKSGCYLSWTAFSRGSDLRSNRSLHPNFRTIWDLGNVRRNGTVIVLDSVPHIETSLKRDWLWLYCVFTVRIIETVWCSPDEYADAHAYFHHNRVDNYAHPEYVVLA